MRKIIATAILAFAIAAPQAVQAWWQPADFSLWTTTIVVANRTVATKLSSSAIVEIGWYQVLSTGNTVDTLNFYDASMSSDQANRIDASTGYPVNVIGMYPVGFVCTTGAYVTIDSWVPTAVRVRLGYKIRHRIY